MTTPHSDRLARLQELMRETGTDLVAIGPSSHMMWLSGLDPHGDERPVMLLVGPDHAGFLMPALNAGAARRVTDLPLHCWSDDAGPEAALTALLTECGATRPGLSVVLDETMRADFALRLLDALDAPRRRFSEFTIIGFGGNGAFPHHHTGETRLAPGMAVLIDSGCRHMGYPSDMTRCGWFGGTPEPEFLEVAVSPVSASGTSELIL